MESKTKQLVIALVVGAAALMGNKLYLDSERDALLPKNLEKVVRTKKSIPAGTVLSQGLVEMVQVPKAYVPRSAVRWTDLPTFLGQQVSYDLPATDYLLESSFSARTVAGNRLSEQIEGENARAVTIPVDDINSLSRSIAAGDRVDIVYTFSVAGTAQKMSVVFLQNVAVIATGSYSAAEQEGSARASARYGTITLKLSARDAVRLNYARQSGQINVMLRNAKDTAALDLDAITNVKDLLSAGDRERVEAAIKAGQPAGEMADRLKEQFREILEAQRAQGKK